MFVVQLIVGTLMNAAIFFALLFLPAGTLHWWRGWVIVGLSAFGSVVTLLTVFRDRPDLLAERFKPPIQKQQTTADKILVSLLLLGFMAILILAARDVFHLHLMPQPGIVVSSLGLILAITGWVIISLTFKENAFAAPVVKLQTERKHSVIDTGVYSVVRHPMYAGSIPYLLGMALWLESYAAAILTVIPVALLAVRIVFEERFLRRELQGYEAYTRRVRYRLIPFIW